MKKVSIIILAVILVLTLFSACGTNGGTTPTQTPTSAPDGSQTPGTPDSPDTPDAPDVPETPFKVDEFGIAMEPYDWPLPLTDDHDTPLTYWWTTSSPQYIPADKEYGDTDLPVEVEKRTGVKIEYVYVPSSSRKETFSILLAADDLCDMMTYATAYYPGTTLQMVEDGYFANIYDYREYMPNYLYQSKWADPDDRATYESVFYEDDLIPVAWVLWEGSIVTDTGYCVRQDFLDKVGMKSEDLKTWDDYVGAMRAVKSAIDTVEFPLWMSAMIETNNYWYFNSFENISVITTIAMPPVFFRDGELVMGCTSEGDKQFAEKISSLFAEKMVNPDWQGYYFAQAFQAHTLNNEVFWQGHGTTFEKVNKDCSDPNCNWVPVGKPLITADQVVHAGTIRSRTSTGNCAVSVKNTNIELCMKWIDYHYSPSGWELFSYGPEGLVVYKDENGVRHNTEWALNNPDGIELSGLVSIYTASRFLDPCICVYDVQLLNPDGESAIAAVEYWTEFDRKHYDRAGALPIGVRLSTEQSEEVNKYRADIITYVAETFASFVDGSTPMSEWGNYQKTLEQMGLKEILAAYQEAYDDYLAKIG